MIHIAAGIHTGKMYAFGKDGAEVRRNLIRDYKGTAINRYGATKIYPEPLMIRQEETDDEK